MNSPTNEDLRDWVGEHSGFDAEIGTELLARRASHDDLVAALKEARDLISYAGQDAVSSVVAEANRNKAWHVLSAALAKAEAQS
jgi:hypothetical protein